MHCWYYRNDLQKLCIVLFCPVRTESHCVTDPSCPKWQGWYISAVLQYCSKSCDVLDCYRYNELLREITIHGEYYWVHSPTCSKMRNFCSPRIERYLDLFRNITNSFSEMEDNILLFSGKNLFFPKSTNFTSINIYFMINYEMAKTICRIKSLWVFFRSKFFRYSPHSM